jgi:hypothetical protein
MDWPESELELQIGESVFIGDIRLTILDVDGDEIFFQIERPESGSDWVPLCGDEDLLVHTS